MRIIAYIVLLFSFPLLADATVSNSCLRDDNTTKLVGKLAVQTFPGLPNYTNIEKGDEAETYWILTTKKEYCGEGQSIETGNVQRLDEKSRHFQLVLTPEQYKQYKNFLNKQIVVTGKMFIGHTGHHHTPMLIEVNQMEAAP